MNKYQEAMDVIARYISDCKRGINRYSDREINDSLSKVNELVEKYRWHDLRKDSKDLPKEDGFVMAMFKGKYKPSIVTCLNGDFGEYIDFVHFEAEGYPVETYFEFYDNDTDEIVAWKYIEEFEYD